MAPKTNKVTIETFPYRPATHDDSVWDMIEEPSSNAAVESVTMNIEEADLGQLADGKPADSSSGKRRRTKPLMCIYSHAFTFCVRCPGVEVAVLQSPKLPSAILSGVPDDKEIRHGIAATCCRDCRETGGNDQALGRCKTTHEVGQLMQGLRLNPERVAPEVKEIARAVVGVDIEILTDMWGGVMHVEPLDLVKALGGQDAIASVNVMKFRGGERTREGLLKHLRGGYI